ncbi:MAG: choice-of-anchor tandem repeat GloVer-containing protein, partial [Bacteroidota bacterium]
ANPDNKGNVFRMNLDGSGFTVLHEFAGGPDDGWKPWSGLAISGSTLYGSTVYGGPHGETGGVLYAMNTDGSAFRLLHSFGGPGDGFGASTSPTLIGDTLYGLTRWGGEGAGTIYSYNILRGVFTLLHRFAADGSQGSFPLGTVTDGRDGFLYGLAWQGGLYNMGSLFRLRPDGSSFAILHHFSGGIAGMYPYDSLLFDGDHTLYGTTLGTYGAGSPLQGPDYRSDPLLFGGDPLLNPPSVSPALALSSDLGTVFKYDLAVGSYAVLHRFAGGSTDSAKPNGSLVLSADGLRLYGTTHGDTAWGGSEPGILYRMNIDGSGFIQLYEFAGGMVGDTPMKTPLLIDQALYGTTAYGGTEDYGLIYRFQPSGDGSTPRKLSVRSTGALDGWILESGETTNQGGMLDKSATTFNVGDNQKDEQFRAILSFNTAALPDNATIVSAQLKVRRQAAVGTDPFITHGPLLVDLRRGGFSGNWALQLSDFSAAPTGTARERILLLTGAWYAAQMGPTNLLYINKFGVTQFRLRFSKDDNDDLSADYLRFFSGDASTPDYRPVLVIGYTVP